MASPVNAVVFLLEVDEVKINDDETIGRGSIDASTMMDGHIVEAKPYRIGDQRLIAQMVIDESLKKKNDFRFYFFQRIIVVKLFLLLFFLLLKGSV